MALGFRTPFQEILGWQKCLKIHLFKLLFIYPALLFNVFNVTDSVYCLLTLYRFTCILLLGCLYLDVNLIFICSSNLCAKMW